MRLSLYFFRQYLPPFFFGFILFSFVFLLDKLFDLVDLILNKGVAALTVLQMIVLFIPTTFPLTLPMAILLGCMVSFGRLSEENEITAVRAAGISLAKILWIFPLFAFVISALLVPFNTQLAPWINRAFRSKYEQIAQSDPLIKVLPKKFFSIKNLKIYAHQVDNKNQKMKDLFVYQVGEKSQPSERIFARTGHINSNDESFQLILQAGQLQRLDNIDPRKLLHVSFDEYIINIPLNIDKDHRSMRFRNISTEELRKMIQDHQKKGFKTHHMESEVGLRYALAFAPFAFVLIGIPLATSFKRGGRAYNTGMSLVVIFIYYLLLILGLTLAEKGIFPAHPSLWIANGACFLLGCILLRNLIRK
ncbi:hypothetical protein BVX98_04065 [bacterium F11]|nr:hypothetical protein BVX98_04065 [bacterium F11]